VSTLYGRVGGGGHSSEPSARKWKACPPSAHIGPANSASIAFRHTSPAAAAQ